jgi:hypothetical protein
LEKLAYGLLIKPAFIGHQKTANKKILFVRQKDHSLTNILYIIFILQSSTVCG